MTPFVMPADWPSYLPTGHGNELMLLGEFSRTVPVTCIQCGITKRFKLVADELHSDEESDQILNRYLRRMGWVVGDNDICPRCASRRGGQ